MYVAAADMSSVATLAKPTPGGVLWKPAQITALRSAIKKLLMAPTLRGAQVGLIVADTVRGFKELRNGRHGNDPGQGQDAPPAGSVKAAS